MTDLSQIKEHTPVRGSDGQHVGTVDHVDGQRIKLTKNDPSANGQHHYLDASMIASVTPGEVRLNCSASEAKAKWVAA